VQPGPGQCLEADPIESAKIMVSGVGEKDVRIEIVKGNLLGVVVLIISAARWIDKLNPFRNGLWCWREGRNESIEGKMDVTVGLLEEGAGSSRLDTIAMLVKHFFESNQIIFIAHYHDFETSTILLLSTNLLLKS
jgi:hypothetical protein